MLKGAGSNAGVFNGFGLLGKEMSQHGTFVKDGDNMVLKFGMGLQGFTGNDYVLDCGAGTAYAKLGFGTYTVKFDIKPSATVIAKTFYLRVQGGPAEGYVQYVVPFQGADVLDAAKAQAGWDKTVTDGALVLNQETGWYTCTFTFDMTDTAQMDGRTLWIMAGIANATVDDYYLIDNVSFKKTDFTDTVLKEELIVDGGFDTATEGKELLGGGTGVAEFNGFGLLGKVMSKHGTFVKDGNNMVLKFGMGLQGFTGNDYVLDCGASTNFATVGKGVYTFEFDVKPSSSVIAKTFYLRVQGGPAEGYPQYLVNFQAADTIDAATAQASWNSNVDKGVITAGQDGWYTVSLKWTMDDSEQMTGRNLWIMAGIANATEDDYYLIDNLSFKRTEELKKDDLNIELAQNGGFDGIANETQLLGAGSGAGSYNGFGLLEGNMSNHGQFVATNDNKVLKVGAGLGGFTGNDYVVEVAGTGADTLPTGDYTLSFDIKPSASVIDKTFYFRVQRGAQAEGYELYIINHLGDNQDVWYHWSNAIDDSKIVADQNGWYKYTTTYTISENKNNNLWIMIGITSATADDYYLIDNVSFKNASSEEKLVGGDCEALTIGNKIKAGVDNGIFNGFVADKEHAIVSYEDPNVVLEFGKAGGGFTKIDYVLDTGINCAQIKKGVYTFAFDIKAHGDVIDKCNYLRMQAGPAPVYPQYVLFNTTHRTFTDLDSPTSDITWDTAKNDWTDLGNGWYRVSITWEVDEAAAGTIWLMMGLTTEQDPTTITATADDFFYIDNISLMKTAQLQEVDDGSVEIPEAEQVEIFEGFDKVLGTNTSVKISGGKIEGTTQGAYNGQAGGWVATGKDASDKDTAIFNLGYTAENTLINENGWNMSYYTMVDFDGLGSGYYTLAFDIKANGNVVAATRYLRTFLNSGDKTMVYMISMNSTNPTKEWNNLVANKDTDLGTMTDLGNGWYRYSRTFVVSNAKNNTDCDRVVIQQGGDFKDEQGADTYGTPNQVSTQKEGVDFWSIANMSIKKVREIAEAKPKLAASTEATKAFDAKNPQDVTINIKWNGCELQVVKAKHTSESDFVSLGSVAAAKNVAWTEDNGTTPGTLVIKKEWLSNLKKNGEYTLQIVTLERTMEVVITVSNYEAPTEEPVVDPTPAKKKGCGSSIALTSVATFAALIAAGFVVARKKKED